MGPGQKGKAFGCVGDIGTDVVRLVWPELASLSSTQHSGQQPLELTGSGNCTLIAVSGLKLCKYLVSQMPVLRANFKIRISFWFDKTTWTWHLKVFWAGGATSAAQWRHHLQNKAFDGD